MTDNQGLSNPSWWPRPHCWRARSAASKRRRARSALAATTTAKQSGSSRVVAGAFSKLCANPADRRSQRPRLPVLPDKVLAVACGEVAQNWSSDSMEQRHLPPRPDACVEAQ